MQIKIDINQNQNANEAIKIDWALWLNKIVMLWTLPVPIIHQKLFLAYANLAMKWFLGILCQSLWLSCDYFNVMLLFCWFCEFWIGANKFISFINHKHYMLLHEIRIFIVLNSLLTWVNKIRITFQLFTFTLMIADLIDRILRSEVLYYNQCTRSDLERWNSYCVTKLTSGKCYQTAAKTKTKKRIHNRTKSGACSFSHSIIKIECLI